MLHTPTAYAKMVAQIQNGQPETQATNTVSHVARTATPAENIAVPRAITAPQRMEQRDARVVRHPVERMAQPPPQAAQP